MSGTELHASRRAEGESMFAGIRRLAAVLVVLPILLAASVYAAELRAIEDALSEETSDAMISFMAMRCAATFLAVAAQFEVDGGAQFEKEVADFRQAGAEYFAAAVTLSGMSNQQMTSNVGGMALLYREDMRANYFATGNRLDGVTARDLKFCSEATKGNVAPQ